MRQVAAAVMAGALALATAGVADAATHHTQPASQTFTLASGQTSTFSVAYPDALEYGGATYSGKVAVLAAGSAGKAQPRARLVRILSRGSSEGGSLYTVKVHDANPAGVADVRVRLTATTSWTS